MTDISVTSPVERIARVLAAASRSINAEGDESSAGEDVDIGWNNEVNRAMAVLRTLREATPEMVEAGRAAGSDPAEIWNAMVRAAIGQQETV
ncbi:hypothetical protein FHS95_000176 [Sphingomonas naasensis]|uniref:Uncharacterized protein n=1 Tax=Sphingomonas naasensis TaxID=1344951 RepID=A0A4S1WU92_9SPHN|nr:hypothetical protein [Sphingomonas naasensis]NIJ18507.1 hypothetical protein [Sphingomonas naasensis]TGX45760.1 hypothetical protein E5A74_00845 [Sphingomonas naasensis]